MMNTIFLRKLTIVLVAVFFASCDKDFNTLGSDIVGSDDFTATPELFPVKAYNQKLPAVQTNNLPVNQLGVMCNSVLGTTKSNFVTQLSLAIEKPTFKSNITIDSVVLTVPYYSTKILVDANGVGTYTLNSIYTTNTAGTYDPIDLKVFRNGVTLRDSDPSGVAHKYYSDQDANFSAFVVGSKLNTSTNVKENTAFVPDTREYKKYKVVNNSVTTDVESHNSPRMRLHLDTDYFKENIIKASAANLDNNNAFSSYFKGLYFQVSESVIGKGTSMALDFAKGDVTIYYKQDVIDVPGSVTPSINREMASLTLNMTANTVNLFNNAYSSGYTNAVSVTSTDADVAGNGAKNLYLKGGQGSIAFIELFPGVAGETKLTELKNKKVLVNEASLTFTVNKTNMLSSYNKPKRIYIFDADNNIPLYDYYLDNSENSTDITLNKILHGGIIREATVGTTDDTYKIRITEHVNRILRGVTGSKNVRLGVAITENIGLNSLGYLNPSQVPAHSSDDATKIIDKSPVSSTISPLGTVLYGSNYLPTDGADYEKRIKFEIYYTKPN
ncbi:DUF4270 domain-containing protein [Flavobacterium psychrophilum]|nr:DUF4270 domain-containing protein [Flavobacterium psychrophilum]